MVCAEMCLDGRTDLYVFARGGIMEARHSTDIQEYILRSYASAIGDAFILMQDIARAHMTFLGDKR